MLTRWQGGFATVVVTAVTAGLVVLDLTDEGFRRWWVGHALTTDTVAGLLVLLITILIVDQVVRRRQLTERSRAIAAQAAIMAAQAARSSKAVSAVLGGSGDRAAASDEVRTYMMMLLAGAPGLIDAAVSRGFLEEAQLLGAEMARALTVTARTPDAASKAGGRLDAAVTRFRDASAPLLQVLNIQELLAAGADELPWVPQQPG